MWFDRMAQMPTAKAHRPAHRMAAGIACWLALTSHTQVHATEADLPILCNVQTAPDTTAPVEATDNCVEFGAAVGELGLEWRQKLPDNVRWIIRKDALALCSQTQSEWGQKAGNTMDHGCVFRSPKACTIVTASYISHATLGNAVRTCAP
jgi:hypothetical protein